MIMGKAAASIVLPMCPAQEPANKPLQDWSIIDETGLAGELIVNSGLPA